MAGKGAPQGNQYAKKGDTGRTISLYLSGEDMAIIRQILQDRGEDASEQACVKIAKQAAMSGIYQLVVAKKYEGQPTLQARMDELVDQLFNMVRLAS